ncbi:MAG TPA: cytidylate kinase-like family protein [Gemmatimonadaceae bacterium]|nr:cytidylate kinase-like family protein [Gemmatimonadaceae bacterium]
MAIITISRMYGSGGSEIAARVAKLLGWSLFDNAFVDAVAERLGIPVSEVQAREERTPSLVERLASALAVASPEILPPPTEVLPPSEERLADVTRRIIEEAVARGNAVLVGRGAQSVLARRAGVLHVFCYAPREALARRVAERLRVPLGEAEKKVDEINKQREQYVRAAFKRSWKAHDNYHLAVNTEWLGIEGTAQLIVSAAQRMGIVRRDENPG